MEMWIRHSIFRIGFVVLILTVKSQLNAQSLQSNLWMSDGSVNASTISGDTIFIGGTFTYIGPYRQHLAKVSTSGTIDTGFPQTDGIVNIVLADGSGGWYVGGSFTSIGGTSRNNLARVLSDNSIDATWNPNPNSSVNALLLSGTTLYVGGGFSSIGGESRNMLAAVSTTTGNATSWNPAVNNTVYSMALSGSTLYIVGIFSSVGDSARNRIAAVNSTTAIATSWNPTANANVYSVAVSGSTVYVGGDFSGVNSIGDSTRNRIAAIDATTGIATSWNPGAGGSVWALAVSGTTLYVGGDFVSFTTGGSRNRLAAFNTSTGSIESWNPNVSGRVTTITVSGSIVYIGGQFTTVSFTNRNRVAAINTSGVLEDFNPGAITTVNSVAVSGSDVCVGGQFKSFGGVQRNRIAAVNLTTGEALQWNPSANGEVKTLAVSGSLVYVGGMFSGSNSIGGALRNRIAAIERATGTATAWNPSANNTVHAVAVSGSTVYAAGEFSGTNSIGGADRNRIAAIDASTGTATSWNPNANNYITSMLVSGSTVYVGGFFFGTNSIGGADRDRIAAIDASTGNATSWNPGAQSGVNAMALSGSSLYVGGSFTSIGGESRQNLAELSTSTGSATSWNPNPNSHVSTIALTNNNVYVGGGFSFIGGQSRTGIAAVSRSTGLSSSWNPNINNNTNTIALSFSTATVFLGGSYTSVFGTNRSGLAGLTNPDDSSLPVELESFTATARSGIIELQWKTATELNNHGFEVEKRVVSGRNATWKSLGFVDGNGTTNVPKEYSFVDRVDMAGKYAYRLKQIDRDGAFVYSQEVEISAGKVPQKFDLEQNYPNPFNPSTTIGFTLKETDHATLKIYDAIGREVAVLVNEIMEAGNYYQRSFDASTFSSGIYFARLTSGTNVQLKKMLLIK